MMDYKEKYKEALKIIEILYNVVKYQSSSDALLASQTIEKAFPELKESDDERIRKALMQNLKERFGTKGNMGEGLDMPDVLAWLEKQGEQKPVDKVEPKFKVGDWVRAISSGNIFKILSVNDGLYRVLCYDGVEANYPIEEVEKDLAYWTIQDAKDGDVLAYVTDEEDLWIMIYWSLYEPYEGHVHYHAFLFNDNFSDKGTCCICIDNLKPATKEQRKLLFKKMKEAGYEWNAEKKELKKIEQNPVWNEEDEQMFNSIIEVLEVTPSARFIPIKREIMIPWLKSLKDRMKGE